jgi:aldehyde dehydrogenase (NAD+)
MFKFADLIETKADEIATIEAASIGQPIAIAKMLVSACAATYRYYAGWADKIAGESYKEEDGTYKILQYEPYGVCAGIAAWYVSDSILALVPF